MTTVLGVDGGQSAIRLGHSADGRVVEVEGVSRLEGDAVTGVAEQVARGWHQGAFVAVDRVVLGLTTAPADPASADRLCRLVSATTGAPDVWLADDAVTAHAGALSMGWGVSIMAGTGVAALARSEHGASRIVGGHGFLLGDEGGAFWIGRRGLVAVLRADDGRAEPTLLSGAAERRYGDVAAVHIRLHELARPVDAIARFAPDVMEAADAGDAVAAVIIDDAADELVLLVRSALRALGAVDGEVPVALGGRLLEPGTRLRREVDLRLASAELPIAPRTADASALVGAIELGLAGEASAYRDLIHCWHQGTMA